jgi:hypothetical protein
MIKQLTSDPYEKSIVTSKQRNRVLYDHKQLKDSLCKNNACSDLVYSSSRDSIRLISASYNRLSKWSDNLDQRIKWENTIAGDLIMGSTVVDHMNRLLQDKDIVQLKFGSWTRESPIIAKLMELSRHNKSKKTKKKRF